MYRPASPLARGTAALVALVALASLVLQFLYLTGGQGLGPIAAAWDMSRFLTILTTILLLGTFARIAISDAHPDPRWLAAVTLATGLVAIAYHLLLRGLNEVTGLGLLADLGFHTIGPLLVIGWWVAFAPKSTLAFTDVPFFLIWPAIYLSYALTRGALERVYPYPFLDPLAIGWTAVLWTIAKFTIALAVTGGLMVFLGRLLDRG